MLIQQSNTTVKLQHFVFLGLLLCCVPFIFRSFLTLIDQMVYPLFVTLKEFTTLITGFLTKQYIDLHKKIFCHNIEFL